MTDNTPDTTANSSDDSDTASNSGSVAADIDTYTDEIASQVATRMAAQSDTISLNPSASQTTASDSTAINAANSIADRVTALIQTDAIGSVDPSTTDSGRGVWWYDLNGLRVTSNPEKHLVGPRIDQKSHGLTILSDAPRKRVPNVITEYVPSHLPGRVNPIDEAGSKLEDGIPIAFEGEAGTGKNTLFDTLHGKTNRPLYRSNLGLDTSIYDLSNDRDVINGTTVNNLGDLSMAATFGGTWLADEVNMLEGDISSHIHAAAEEPGKRTVDIFGTDRVLTDLPDDIEWDPEKHLGHYIHPDFCVAGTMNPLTYSSVKEMNNAFRGRFSVKTLDYMGESEESGLLADDVGVDTAVAEKLVSNLASELRAMYRNDELRCPISYRQLLFTLTYYKEHSVPLDTAAEAELIGYAQLPGDKTAIEDAINDEL